MRILGSAVPKTLLPCLVLWRTVGALQALDFLSLFDSSAVFGRAVNTTIPLADGQIISGSLAWGEIDYYAFAPANTTAVNVYVTLNTCTQPAPAPSLGNTTAQEYWQDTGHIPALTVYGSNDSTITLPNATSFTNQEDFLFGFANLTYYANTNNLYFSVQAPSQNGTWANQSFTYQIGLSTNQPLHRAWAGDQNRFLFLQDSDFSAALLTTGNLSVNLLPNYQIWINPSAEVPGNFAASLQQSLKYSWCGITQSSAQVTINDADRSMTTRGPGGRPKEQFYVHDLMPSTFYDSYITLQNNYTTGGAIWPVQTFRTRDSKTCQVIYNMDFCNEVAYSVPSNSTLFNPTALAGFYDNLAASYYTNFSSSVQVLNCNASTDAAYSLVSNCDDCRSAYKDWICAATIPRCADLTNPASFLAYRNFSRNPAIDAALHPGDYKEVLPCGDLVQTVTRKCPVALGIRQPHGSVMFNAAYGQRSNNATITCNAPGVDFWVASATRSSSSLFLLAIAFMMTSLMSLHPLL